MSEGAQTAHGQAVIDAAVRMAKAMEVEGTLDGGLRERDRLVAAVQAYQSLDPSKGEQTFVGSDGSVMLSVAGRAYRCECGANVFVECDANTFRCNGCGADHEAKS